MKPILILILAAALVAGIAPAAENPNDLFQQALVKERTEGNLPEAIKLYQRIVDKYASNRKVAAQALLQLAECQTKLGDAQARKSLERLVRDFADQTETVALAKARLTALGGARSGVVYRQAWAGPKVDTFGKVSTDGRYLSYVDWDTGDLALRDFVTNTDRRLTDKGTWTRSAEFAEESAISRDGKQVAYAWYNGKDHYELRIANLPASGVVQPRRLFDMSGDRSWIAPFDWSSDSKWLGVALGRKDGTYQAGLVSTLDGSLRVLKSVTQDKPTTMSFSPDGKHLAADFRVGQTNDRDVFLWDVAGGSESKPVTGASRDTMMGWSPDGKRLLFASDRSGSTGLWAIPMADGKPQGAPELVRPGIGTVSLGVTASGALHLGATINDMDIHVAFLDFNTGKLLSPPARPIQDFTGANSQPDWSPDGKYLAYVRTKQASEPGRPGGDRVLAIRSVETGQVRELRPNLSMIFLPRWAPDGRSFVFEGTDSQGRQGIYRIDAETGEASPIAVSSPGSRFRGPQWSPDGRKIYYSVTPYRDAAMVERDLVSGSERGLIRREGLLYLSVSPDGRYVAGTSMDPSSKSSSLLLLPIDGGEPRELLRVTAPQRFWPMVAWMPDGRGVVVRKMLSDSENASEELWLVPVGDGQPRQLEIDTRYLNVSPISIHPDGRQIAYLGGEKKQEVWVLENFLPAAKAAK